MGLIIFGIIFGILSFIVIYFCNTYNKLIEIKNIINDNWYTLNEDIKYRVELVNTFLPVVNNLLSEEEIINIKRMIANYPILVSQEDIINLYINLEKSINNIILICDDKKLLTKEWSDAFNENKKNIVNKKLVYNDNVLKYNSILLAQRSAIVGKVAKFSTLTYFRNED